MLQEELEGYYSEKYFEGTLKEKVRTIVWEIDFEKKIKGTEFKKMIGYDFIVGDYDYEDCEFVVQNFLDYGVTNVKNQFRVLDRTLKNVPKNNRILGIGVIDLIERENKDLFLEIKDIKKYHGMDLQYKIMDVFEKRYPLLNVLEFKDIIVEFEENGIKLRFETSQPIDLFYPKN
jgi:hypothetical protein